jgi:hypothetical protein
MSQTNPGQQSTPTDTTTLAILCAAIGGVGYGIWCFFRLPVLYCLLGPAWLQLYILSFLGVHGGQVSGWLTWSQAVLSGRYPATLVTFTELNDCFTVISAKTFWFYTLIFAVPAGFLIGRSKPSFTREFSLGGYKYADVARCYGRRAPQWLANRVLIRLSNATSSRGWVRLTLGWLPKLLKLEVSKERISTGVNFIEYQSRAWPQLAAVVNFDPTDCIPSLTDGLRPEYWAAFRGVISKEDAARIIYRKPSEDIGVIKWDRSKARNALATQVSEGGIWQGFEKAPVHVQAVCLLAASNRKVLNPAVIKIAGACALASQGLFNLRADATRERILAERKAVLLSISKTVAQYSTAEAVETINALAKGHGYARTATIAVVGKCGPNRGWGGGSYGPLQSSLFLWLKPLDRSLFFCCQAIGANTYPIEAAGALAHFQAESLAVREKLPVPQIWVEGPVRWLEGLFERGENGPMDPEPSIFDDIINSGGPEGY